MLKTLLNIPDTFDSDESRRRVILNALLVIFILTSILTIVITIVVRNQFVNRDETTLLMWTAALVAAVSGILLILNRLTRVPGWFGGVAFVIFLITIFSITDSPHELFSGRSLIVWTLPIMVGAVILPAESAFIIAAVIFGMIQIFTPANEEMVNYYAMIALLVVAFISWLGMSIASNALRDARREAANNRTILNSIADGVMVLDLQGKLHSANPALLQMISADDLQEIISRPLESTIRWKRKVFSVSISPVPELGTVAVFRDETRRHEIEHARDALLATASHELRTPLAAIMNYLELLLMLSKMGKIDTEAFTEHLTRAIENTKRLQNLVNDILDQAQIQAGVLEFKLHAFDLRSLLKKVGSLLDSLIQQKKLSYELAIDSDVPTEIVGDPDRLHQVLVNLIGNGIKFTNQGGIKVSVALDENKDLSIQVADTGPGIPPEQLPDIFEAFRRGSNYAQRERQGAGLGLSIARQIVTRMGGEISVASQLGLGSTFTVTLPVELA